LIVNKIFLNKEFSGIYYIIKGDKDHKRGTLKNLGSQQRRLVDAITS
jgi:hypothetical protein